VANRKSQIGKEKKGRLFVLSAPSGSGKTTILNAVLKQEPNTVRSVSATTRAPRKGERNGVDYHFLTEQQFRDLRKRNGFLETARILDHWYGTPKKPIEAAIRKGKWILLGIDIQGARQLRRFNLLKTTIFLLPPSVKTLERRLKKRGTETPRQIRERLLLARKELKAAHVYDYQVVNDKLPQAISAVRTILQAEQYRVNG